MEIRVVCRSGWRADEAPLAVQVGGQRLEVSELLETWLEESSSDRSRRRLFRVRLTSGETLKLSHDEVADSWLLVGRAPRTAAGSVVEDPTLHGQVSVYQDRVDAGRTLARLLSGYRSSGALVLAIPAGGVPVAIEIADALGLELDLAVTSKVTLPWNTESGCGAVTFDGTVLLDNRLLRRAGLDRASAEPQVEVAQEKVRRRMERLRRGRPLPRLQDRTVIVVDDGLASGVTMTATVEALMRTGARDVVVAVPTGHEAAVGRLASLAAQVVCPNVRGGPVFAVADAYQEWRDLSEDEIERLLRDRSSRP